MGFKKVIKEGTRDTLLAAVGVGTLVMLASSSHPESRADKECKGKLETIGMILPQNTVTVELGDTTLTAMRYGAPVDTIRHGTTEHTTDIVRDYGINKVEMHTRSGLLNHVFYVSDTNNATERGREAKEAFRRGQEIYTGRIVCGDSIARLAKASSQPEYSEASR